MISNTIGLGLNQSSSATERSPHVKAVASSIRPNARMISTVITAEKVL